MSNKLSAIIDLGSLKAKLMVFDTSTLDVVFQKSYLTLLGKKILETGTITEEALNNLDEAFSFIKKELFDLNCFNLKFIATESLRIAKNKNDVYSIVDKYFPTHQINIIDQELEGEAFFKAVSLYFPSELISVMDIGGGSVQIFNGIFKDEKYLIKNKYLYKTGTYSLQQKYSPDSSIISKRFGEALNEVKTDFKTLKDKSDILIFGSTLMQDFLEESGVLLYKDKPFLKHPFYTTAKDLNNLLIEIRKFTPNNRKKFFSREEHFAYGADYLLINVIEAAERLGTRYIYPTNLNSSYGFVR